MYEKLEAVLNEHVRPLLQSHGGDMEVVKVEDGVLHFKMLGQCAGCPAADLTTEDLIQTQLAEHMPSIKQAVLVQGVSDELLAQARAIMQMRRGK